jgi:hypothetical protein
MQDVLDIIKNIEDVYESDTAFQILKDFERVLDQLDIYVYENWEDGELAAGPIIEKHWVTCSFMWDRDKMPDPTGGKRLVDYDCKVRYKKDYVLKPRKIRTPDDIRPGTKKGKLDRKPIWIVEIQMPIDLIKDIYTGYAEMKGFMQEPAVAAQSQAAPEAQVADTTAAEATPDGGVEGVAI